MCTSWPRAATPCAIGSMNVPTVSPGKRGYDVVIITINFGHSDWTRASRVHTPPRMLRSTTRQGM